MSDTLSPDAARIEHKLKSGLSAESIRGEIGRDGGIHDKAPQRRYRAGVGRPPSLMRRIRRLSIEKAGKSCERILARLAEIAIKSKDEVCAIAAGKVVLDRVWGRTKDVNPSDGLSVSWRDLVAKAAESRGLPALRPVIVDAQEVPPEAVLSNSITPESDAVPDMAPCIPHPDLLGERKPSGTPSEPEPTSGLVTPPECKDDAEPLESA